MGHAQRQETARFRRLVEALQGPAPYPHPVREIRVVETHISAVLLTGEYAYKLKKPVDLGFLDFTTLAARRHYCEEELRLNRRTAPGIYLEVVAVRGSPDAPRIGGAGEVLDYAVKMRQFPDRATLAERLEEADPASMTAPIAELAVEVARLHDAAPPAVLDPARYLREVEEQAAGNLRVLARFPRSGVRSAAAGCASWSEREWRLVKGAALERLERGRVREGHGDLHLGNVVLLDGALHPFDCVEFSPALRTGDVMSDACFLEMDLRARGLERLANRYLDAYLEASGDYPAMAVHRFFMVYRALVRAKVAALAAAGAAPVSRYLAAAARFTRRPARPCLLVMHGLSGSGKSTVAAALVDALGVIRIRSDVERKRLAGLAATARPGRGLDLYSRSSSAATYDRLAALSASVLRAGRHVVADATFLAREERARFGELAARGGYGFVLVHARAAPATLAARVARRGAAGSDPSDADLAVLEAQRASVQPLDPGERRHAVTVDTDAPGALARAVEAVRGRLLDLGQAGGGPLG